MSTTTISVTAASFEKAILRSVNSANCLETYSVLDEHSAADDFLADWHEIASKTVATDGLGDALRCAIESLPMKSRQVLFLHDIKGLDPEETAWVLNTNVGAVRARLSHARMQMRDALLRFTLTSTHGEASKFGSFCGRFQDVGRTLR
jgi:DNA-directed RNA polymerase specialized sigma24 family protein